ncbi:hypothetical protein GCM10007979_42860 [Nocardioides albus]|nr:hypothetical protein GCM10007979_42860 [Nocardioides albus]
MAFATEEHRGIPDQLLVTYGDLVPTTGTDAHHDDHGARRYSDRTVTRCPDCPAIGNGEEGRTGESGKPVRVRRRPAAVIRAPSGDSVSPKTGPVTIQSTR